MVPAHPLPGVDLTVLSPREREVLEEALSGAPVSAIAWALSLSEATVRSHLAHIYAKLGVSGRLELLARTTAVSTPHPPALPRASEARPLWHPITLGKLSAIAVVAIALGLGAGFVVIGAFNAALPFRYPEDDDTMRERIPVALAYMAWFLTSAVIFLGGFRRLVRK